MADSDNIFTKFKKTFNISSITEVGTGYVVG